MSKNLLKNAAFRALKTPGPAGPSAARLAAKLGKEEARAAAQLAARNGDKSKEKAKPAHKGAGEIRIIGGEWRRTRLSVAQRPGLRPTPDRVRETLFNWLGQDLRGWRCLDAFAGTGVLGLEAASRGAASVQLVEQDAGLVAQLQGHQEKLKATTVRVQRGDGVMALRQCAPASMHAIFLDPPFESAVFESALQAAALAVAEDGFVYLEAPTAWDDAALQTFGLSLHRYLKAGAVHAHLLRRAAASAAAEATIEA